MIFKPVIQLQNNVLKISASFILIILVLSKQVSSASTVRIHPTKNLNPYHCPESKMHVCTDYRCIPKEFVCDGENDCVYGTDEKNCPQTTARPCNNITEFKCKSEKCIDRSLVCNGIDECNDEDGSTGGSDEQNCLVCYGGAAHCLINLESSYKKCLRPETVCASRQSVICEQEVDCSKVIFVNEAH